MTVKNESKDELEFFSAQADTWWSDTGPAALLHQINPVRLRFITQTVNLKNLKVLDVGCGGGILTEAMAKLGGEATGLDLAAPLIKTAQKHALEQQLNIDYQYTAVETFAESHPAYYDVITCMEMLEHVPDPKSVVAAMSQMLKPGGFIFLSTLDRSPKSFLKLIIGAEYLLKMLPRGTHHYGQFIRPSELTHALREYGITPIKLGGLDYNILTKTFTLKPTPTENYLLCGQK
jgi:2-polyprenyl-6-hydroxyphenyl methylase / 3-demethylubiquinone-9 3-methyltransferase